MTWSRAPYLCASKAGYVAVVGVEFSAADLPRTHAVVGPSLVQITTAQGEVGPSLWPYSQALTSLRQ